MLMLAVDVGTGTQDILRYNSEKEVENSLIMIMPAPTQVIAEKVRKATRERKTIVLSGNIMGGGPSTFAIRKHLEAGFPVYSTERAALTIHDNLERVKSFGIQIVSVEEARRLISEGNVIEINMQDFDFKSVSEAFSAFGVSMPEDYAIAVQDHGNAPEKSNRIYRFELFKEILDKGGELRNFVYTSEEIPQAFTRMKAQSDFLLETATGKIGKVGKLKKIGKNPGQGTESKIRAVFMDTGPAAIFGALTDPTAIEPAIVVNIGNGHTLGALVQKNRITGLFEHHTSLMNPEKLQDYIIRLADGQLSFEEVFKDQGHGAYIKEFPGFDRVRSIMVTGPKREMLEKLENSEFRPEVLEKLHFAAPFGSMMLSGCFGLLAGFLEKYPDPSIKLINH